jgi:hypothetical protein
VFLLSQPKWTREILGDKRLSKYNLCQAHLSHCQTSVGKTSCPSIVQADLKGTWSILYLIDGKSEAPGGEGLDVLF